MLIEFKCIGKENVLINCIDRVKPYLSLPLGLVLVPRALEVGLVLFFPFQLTPRALFFLGGEREALRLRGVWGGRGE